MAAGDPYKGGGIYVSQSKPTTVRLHDTVVADNHRGTPDIRDDIFGHVDNASRANFLSTESAEYGITDGNNENQIGGLGPRLKPASGTRPYVLAPDVNSPLIDAGDETIPQDPTATDQRGTRRFVDNRVDIGAVEYQQPAVNLTYRYDPTPGKPSEVTLFAFVKPQAPGSNTPTGPVTFYLNDPSNVLGTQPLATGVAALTLQNLPSGKVGIRYAGDDLFSAAEVTFDYGGGPTAPGGPTTPGGTTSPGGTTTPGGTTQPGNPPPTPAQPTAAPVLIGSGNGNQAALLTPDGKATPFGGGVYVG